MCFLTECFLDVLSKRFQATNHVTVELPPSSDSEQETNSQDGDEKAIPVDREMLRLDYLLLLYY